MKNNINKYMKKICIFAVLFSATANFILPFLRIPSYFKASLIVCDILFFVYNIANLSKIISNKYTRALSIPICCLFVVSIISFALNGYSIGLFTLGLFNTFRFFSFLITAFLVFEKEDIPSLLKINHILFALNIVAVLFEYFVLGLERDCISGTFAYMDKGGNAGLAVLLVIELCILLNNFLREDVKLYKTIILLIPILLIAAIAELKIIFVVFAIITIISIILNPKNKRTIIAIVSSIIFTITGIGILTSIYPEWEGSFSISSIYTLLFDDNFGYSNKNDISRGRAFAQIDSLFYEDKLQNKLFGFGIGNCDSSKTLGLYSDFYNDYEETLHYDWFTHSMVYLELGLIGFLAFISIFIVNIVNSFIVYKKCNKIETIEYRSNIIGAFCFSIFCIISIWYDSFFRIGYAYFAFVFIAIPYIYGKPQIESKKELSRGRER